MTKEAIEKWLEYGTADPNRPIEGLEELWAMGQLLRLIFSEPTCKIVKHPGGYEECVGGKIVKHPGNEKTVRRKGWAVRLVTYGFTAGTVLFLIRFVILVI